MNMLGHYSLFMSADTSLEPRPILTQASDLLVRIDLPIIEFSKDIRVRVRLLPENELDDPVEFDIDGVFSGVSTFYPFIPASQVPATFRRFWIQIALIVNNVKGPFNPSEVTSIQFIGKGSHSNHLYSCMSISYCIVQSMELYCSHYCYAASLLTSANSI